MSKSLISYAQFVKDILNFKKSGTKSGSEFNLYETPVNQYFKILFYFHNGDSNSEVGSDGGLLAPTWEKELSNFYQYNSAWSYLKLNGEEERAEKLQNFVNLLSNINSEAPWYFTSISGLDSALERSAGQNKEFKVEEERKKISIKCLPDAFDNRIGTLLDLYRDVVWSWQTKREIVPSNLRKFDMAIYIFSDPIVNIHQSQTDNSASLLDNSSNYKTSYKYIEFHNCEIDYNSSKSAYGELNNVDGFQPEYTIDIYFDDVYEKRYNEFILRTIGDMITYDIISAEKSKAQTNSDTKELYNRFNMYEDLDGFGANALNELIGAGKSWLSNKLTSVYLGNLFTISPKTFLQQVKSASGGQVFNAVNAVDDYLDLTQRKPKNFGDLGNLFKNKSASKNI